MKQTIAIMALLVGVGVLALAVITAQLANARTQRLQEAEQLASRLEFKLTRLDAACSQDARTARFINCNQILIDLRPAPNTLRKAAATGHERLLEIAVAITQKTDTTVDSILQSLETIAQKKPR